MTWPLTCGVSDAYWLKCTLVNRYLLAPMRYIDVVQQIEHVCCNIQQWLSGYGAITIWVMWQTQVEILLTSHCCWQKRYLPTLLQCSEESPILQLGASELSNGSMMLKGIFFIFLSPSEINVV